VKAIVAAVNPHYDMAVLKINSEVAQNIEPLPVLPHEKEPNIKVGIPVVAIGSPLNQKFLMTQGILSKVENTIVMGDFLLQAGNSGGPLLNSDGEVIAINTFGEGNIGGAIRVEALRGFLSSAALLAESIGVEPPGEQLRSVSSVRYPIDVLNEKLKTEELDIEAYKFKAGNFMVTVITPVLIAKLQMARQKPHGHQNAPIVVQDLSQGIQDPFYEWHRSTESSLDYAVTFDVRPETGPVNRNFAVHMIPPMLRFGKIGKPDMEFKGEFYEFRIYRDGVLLEPIMPGRQVLEGKTDKKNQRFVDRAYAGSYVYSPDEFLTGKEFHLQIIDARNPNVIHKEMILAEDSRLIKQLRADFMFSQQLVTSAPRSSNPVQ
jgi:hypothetical protein